MEPEKGNKRKRNQKKKTQERGAGDSASAGPAQEPSKSEGSKAPLPGSSVGGAEISGGAKKEKKHGSQHQKKYEEEKSKRSTEGQQRPQGPPPAQQGQGAPAWGQQRPQVPPFAQQGQGAPASGQQRPQVPPPAQQGQGAPAWGQQRPQVPPFAQQGQGAPASGQQRPQVPPPAQQGQGAPAWGQQRPQVPPPAQQGQGASAWGQQRPQVPPFAQQGQAASAWGQQRPQSQPSAPQGQGAPAWGQQRPQSQPASQTSQEKSSGKQKPRQQHQKQQQKSQPQAPDERPATTSKTIEEISTGIEQMDTRSKVEKSPKTEPSGMSFARRIYADKKSGRPITVATNFFRLIIKNPNLVVYDYDVKIEPERPKYLIREVWNKFAAREFPKRLTAFNGKNAYSNGPLMKEKSRSGTITVFNTESNREKDFNVVVTEVRQVSFRCFDNYRERMLKDSSMKILPEAETTILDIVLRNWACDNFVRSGKSFFCPSSLRPKTKELSGKLTLQNGYYQAAFLGYELYLNFDLAHKAFYKPIHLLDLVKSFQWNQNINIEDMNHFIRGMKIQYQLPNDPSSKKIYSVNGLVKDANSQTFKKDDDSVISVANYLQKEKNIRLQHPKLPLLWVGSRQKTIYLPMEFCSVVPDQVYKGQIDPMETREMVRSATSDTRTRRNDLYKLFADTNINKQPLMTEFGLTVSGEMEQVEGRVLDPPRLKTSTGVRVNEGTWRIRDFLEPKELKNWCILKMDRRVSMENIRNLQNLLKDKGRSFNMRVEEPSRSVIELEPRPREMENVLKDLGNMDLVIVIIPDMKGVYGKVKTMCETQGKILTQCVKSRTVSQDPRKLSTTVENILLKVNAKLGGINHCIDKTSFPDCLKGKVMLIGADVTHSSPGMKIPSVAAVAVSCDEAAFKYSCTTRAQPKGEMIIDLEEIINKHLQEFNRLRKCYPEKIIFFRDGVSEGELEKVYKFELEAVKKACWKYCQPKITFLVVQKRHHTRFFPTSPNDEVGKNYNVPPGTCIDSKVVHPRDLDFYLVSHASILGTARPTRYRLLHDDNKLTDDELERLSYYLCHMFSRCNRSVSYPSPTYNAHLAAFRARAYLEEYRGQFDIPDIQRHIRDNISDKAPMFFV